MEHVPRAQNDIADGLSKCAALKLPVEPGIFVLKLTQPSVAHPRSNGQAERANAEVLHGLKTRTFDMLHKCGRRWIDELPTVLWSIRIHQIKPLARHPLP